MMAVPCAGPERERVCVCVCARVMGIEEKIWKGSYY